LLPASSAKLALCIDITKLKVKKSEKKTRVVCGGRCLGGFWVVGGSPCSPPFYSR